MKCKQIYSELLLILILIIAAYHSTFIWLSGRFCASDSYYSHGFLVPVVTGVLIWHKQRQLKYVKREYNFWGLVLIIFSLIFHLLSMLTEVFFISGFSLLFLIFGISLFLFGQKLTKSILFPLSFLVFMIPMPLVAVNAISFPMKMFATKSAVFVLSSIVRMPIRHEGFQVFFPQGSLVVGNPCSGLRSLIAMLALGSVFAYLLKAAMPKKILLFFLVIPIALISNVVRVILLCLGAFIYGSQIIEGFFHDFAGYLVFVIAFVSLWFIWRKFQCKSLI